VEFPYRFRDPGLATLALTHRSAGKPNNERMEFLGDALLGALVAELLFEAHPNASEGELSRLRAQLVNGQALAVIGRELELGDDLKLGPGELKSGGFRRDSILADAFEALVAAVYSTMATMPAVRWCAGCSRPAWRRSNDPARMPRRGCRNGCRAGGFPFPTMN